MSPTPTPESRHPHPRDIAGRNLLFVSGKGGVGKTAVSQAIAARLNAQGSSVLWATFEDPMKEPGELREVRRGLWHLNCDAALAFEEYAGLKIGVPGLTKVFLRNKLMRYLSQAAPGIHELVLLGKVWFEREHYDHVVVDMPSTGYGLAMFQSTRNFAKLFRGGPINKDAEKMHETFGDPESTGHLIVALPEEMPLRESIELNDFLEGLFPGNPAAFLVNRRFPRIESPGLTPDVIEKGSPLPESALDYARKRSVLEDVNLKIWRDETIPYAELDFVPPETGENPHRQDPNDVESWLVSALERQIADRGIA